MISLHKQHLTFHDLDSSDGLVCSHCRRSICGKAALAVEIDKVLCEKCLPTYQNCVMCISIQHRKKCSYSGCMDQFTCILDNVIDFSPEHIIEDIQSSKLIYRDCNRIKEFLKKYVVEI